MHEIIYACSIISSYEIYNLLFLMCEHTHTHTQSEHINAVTLV